MLRTERIDVQGEKDGAMSGATSEVWSCGPLGEKSEASIFPQIVIAEERNQGAFLPIISPDDLASFPIFPGALRIAEGGEQAIGQLVGPSLDQKGSCISPTSSTAI